MVWMTLLQYFDLCVNSYSCHKRMDLDIIFFLNCMGWVELNLHTFRPFPYCQFTTVVVCAHPG